MLHRQTTDLVVTVRVKLDTKKRKINSDFLTNAHVRYPIVPNQTLETMAKVTLAAAIVSFPRYTNNNNISEGPARFVFMTARTTYQFSKK